MEIYERGLNPFTYNFALVYLRYNSVEIFKKELLSRVTEIFSQ